jgi:hypothetical protein
MLGRGAPVRFPPALATTPKCAYVMGKVLLSTATISFRILSKPDSSIVPSSTPSAKPSWPEKKRRAKAQIFCWACAARLKSYPDTKHQRRDAQRVHAFHPNWLLHPLKRYKLQGPAEPGPWYKASKDVTRENSGVADSNHTRSKARAYSGTWKAKPSRIQREPPALGGSVRDSMS